MQTKISNKINTLMIMTALVIAFSVPAFAMHHEGGEGWEGKDSAKWQEKMENRKKKMFAEIGLTEEQQQKIEANRKAKMAEKKATRKVMKEKKEALRQALDAPVTDRAQIDVLVDDITALKGQGVRNRVNHVLELKETLTPEQFAKLRAKKEEMYKKREGWEKHEGQERKAKKAMAGVETATAN